MADWRKSLLQTGRESDLYHCQLCKHPLWVRRRRLWAVLLHYRGIDYTKMFCPIDKLTLLFISLSNYCSCITFGIDIDTSR